MLSFEILWEEGILENVFSCLHSVKFPLRHKKVKTEAKRLSTERVETCNTNLKSFD